MDPRGLEPPHFRLKGGYSTIELRIPILRIHLRHHCNEIIAIMTVGYTIPIRAPCIHNIISMDTRHPLPVMSGFRHNASSRENHCIQIECADLSPKRQAYFGTTRPESICQPRTRNEYTYPVRGNEPSSWIHSPDSPKKPPNQ